MAPRKTADPGSTTVTAMLQIDDRTMTTPELLELLSQYQLLSKLRQEILIDAAIAPFCCPPEQQAQSCQSFYAQHQLTSVAAQQAWLHQQGLTPAQLMHLATRPWRIEQFKQATWGSKLESYFLQWKSHLDQVTYSLIRVNDAAMAQELYFRLKANEHPFTELAQQYSQGTEARTGGLIGPVALGKPHAKLAQILRSSQPGQLSPPARIENFWVIVRLEQLLPAQLDDPMRQRLLDDLFAIWLKEQLQQPPVIHWSVHLGEPPSDNDYDNDYDNIYENDAVNFINESIDSKYNDSYNRHYNNDDDSSTTVSPLTPRSVTTFPPVAIALTPS
jgi:PPIC-type PPIASE domain